MTATVEDRINDALTTIKSMKLPQPGNVMRPPGPSGNASSLALLRGRVEPYLFFQDVTDHYRPIAYTRLMRQHVYVLTSPETIWEAYVTNNRNTIKGRGLQLTKPTLGRGLLTSEGAEHMRNRRLVQPAFHRTAIEGYAHDMVGASLRAGERWNDRMGEAGTMDVDLTAEMSALTLDVVGRTLLGTDLTGDAGEVGEALETALQGFARLGALRAPQLLKLPTPMRRRMIGSAEGLDRVINKLIADKHEAIAAGRGGHDIASVLIQTVDEETGESLSDDQVRDEIMTLMLAGHETTAMALSWMLRDLAMNPDRAAWLMEEVDALPDRPLEMRDLPSLSRASAVMAEAMRLHPPAWILGRWAAVDIEIGGWHVPAGSVLFASQYAMHRDDRYWSEPDAFLPERWIADGRFDEKAPGVPKGAWFPFGFASRRCIGEQFAWTEGALVLATLLRDWQITVLEPELVRPLAAVTLRPRGLRARLERRAR